MTNRLCFEHRRFGGGSGPKGFAQLTVDREVMTRPGLSRAVQHDAVLRLTIEGLKGDALLGVNLRRDLYVPGILCCAALLFLPMSALRRRTSLCLAAVLFVVFGLIYLNFLVAWYFTHRVEVVEVYAPQGLRAQLMDLLHRVLFMPPANRFIFALAIAALLGLWSPEWLKRARSPGSTPGGSSP